MPEIQKVTLYHYFKRRDEKYRSEFNAGILANAEELLRRVNLLLSDLSQLDSRLLDRPFLVSSGWRPASLNKSVTGAAPRSHHISGKAIDFVDTDNSIDAIISTHYQLLPVHGLWLEHPDHTPGWCHLDMGLRSAREKQIFKP